MSKVCKLIVLLLLCSRLYAQVPHLFEHTYPEISQEDPRIRQLMNEVSVDSIEFIINHLQSYHTRRWDSQMVYEVQDWLYDTYCKLGVDTVLLHDFVFTYHDTLCKSSDNVIAIKKGLVYPNEFVVCGAHYDSYNHATPGDPDSVRAPGADDNASGVSGIMETARVLRHCKFERSIIYCNFAAEEIGLKGSAAYAKDCAEKQMDIVGYFNLDMIGYLQEGSEMQMRLIYVNQDSSFANYIFQFCDVYDPALKVKQGWLSSGDSDFSSFNRNGYPAVYLFENTRAPSPFIHTPDDILGVSVNNLEQAERFTKLHSGLLATLAGLVSNAVDDYAVDGLMVYPNPTTGLVTISGVPLREIEIFNTLGQRVLKETCHEEEVHLDVSSLAAGVYMLRVIDDAMQVHTHRIITY